MLSAAFWEVAELAGVAIGFVGAAGFSAVLIFSFFPPKDTSE